jgi:hypothetical protein
MSNNITHTHNPDSDSCIVQFEDNENMNKALDMMINHHSDGFSGISANSIEITKKDCERFEQMKKENKLSYRNID